MDDKELGAGAVEGLCPGHGDGAPGVGQRILDAIGGELAGDGLIAAAGAVAVGVAALHHEAFHDAVEGQAVIKAILRQSDKVLHSHRGRSAAQCHGDGPVVPDGDIRIGGHLLLCGGSLRFRLLGGLRLLLLPAAAQQAQRHHSRQQRALLQFHADTPSVVDLQVCIIPHPLCRNNQKPAKRPRAIARGLFIKYAGDVFISACSGRAAAHGCAVRPAPPTVPSQWGSARSA